MTREELEQLIAWRTRGHGGPLSRACFDGRCDDCGLYGCNDRCHYVSAAQLRRLMKADG